MQQRRNTGRFIPQALIGVACMGLGVGAKLLLDTRTQPATTVPAANASPAATSQVTPTSPTAELPQETVELGQFLVNVESAAGLHYLRTDVAIRIDVPSGQFGHKATREGEGKEEKPRLPAEEELRAKDAIVQTLSAARFEALRSSDGREKLKAKLLQMLEEKLPRQRIREVLFISFVMQ